ncbi:hypothetical protein TrVFT333_003645 [Trichoderma virens FT-333]|nr:hypothetical protein TrVFT333_003645 [Trichoderma virens FT-333]
MEPKDPDPFLSVDMENLRNRRRHSIAPPTTPTEASSTTPTRHNGARSPLAEPSSPIAWTAPDFESDVPAKRAKTVSNRPRSLQPSSITDNILVQIFQYAEVGELLRLRRVCSHWKTLLTTSPKLCTYVDLSHYNRRVTDQAIIDIIAPFVGTRALVMDLNNCFHITDEGFSVLWRTCGKNVQKWRMRSLWDVSANQILEMSENAKGLKEVDWSNCRKVGDNLLGRVIGWVVPEPPLRLESLSLTRCTSITDAGFQSWAQFKFEKLTQLCLADCTYLSDNAIVALVNAAKNLTHLDLSFCCALSDTATEVVALGLPKLRELRLAFCGSAVSDGSLESVALHLNELEGLSVRGCVRVTGKGLEYILRGCTRLKWVDVSQCRNLEPWLRAGSVSKWGFDSRAAKTELMSVNSWPTMAFDSMLGELPTPRKMSVAMLTTPSFFPRPGATLMGRKKRSPVKFVVEKGPDGLR